MNSEISPERGWRGSRELWLGAATEALIEGGIDAVKILPSWVGSVDVRVVSIEIVVEDGERLCEWLEGQLCEKPIGRPRPRPRRNPAPGRLS